MQRATKWGSSQRDCGANGGAETRWWGFRALGSDCRPTGFRASGVSRLEFTSGTASSSLAIARPAQILRQSFSQRRRVHRNWTGGEDSWAQLKQIKDWKRWLQKGTGDAKVMK